MIFYKLTIFNDNNKIFIPVRDFNLYFISLFNFSWCDPYKTWHDIYNFDPYKPNIDKKRILGAEGKFDLIWKKYK